MTCIICSIACVLAIYSYSKLVCCWFYKKKIKEDWVVNSISVLGEQGHWLWLWPVMEQVRNIPNIQIPPPLGYVDLMIRSGEQFFGTLKECKDCGLTSSWNTLQAHAKFTWIEMLCVVVGALAWTGLRRATTKWIFQVSDTNVYFGPCVWSTWRVTGVGLYSIHCHNRNKFLSFSLFL